MPRGRLLRLLGLSGQARRPARVPVVVHDILRGSEFPGEMSLSGDTVCLACRDWEMRLSLARAWHASSLSDSPSGVEFGSFEVSARQLRAALEELGAAELPAAETEPESGFDDSSRPAQVNHPGHR